MLQKNKLKTHFQAELARNIDPSDAKTTEIMKAFEAAQAKMGTPNTKVYRLAVSFVGYAVILLILGSIFLLYSNVGKEHPANIPEFFSVTLGVAIGALAGMLAPTDLGD